MLTSVAVEEDSKWRDRKIWRQRKGNLSLCLLFIFVSWRWDVRVGACSVSTAHYGMPGSPPSADHQSWSATRRSEGHDICFCFLVLFLHKRSSTVFCDCVWFGTQFYEAVVWLELFPAIKLIENKMFLLQCVKTTECSDNEWLLSDCCSLGLSCKACFSVLDLSVVYKPKYCQKKNLTGRKYLSVFTWLFHQTWIILVHTVRIL